jgi:uncharacterized protein YifE (UPF0438 family)
VGGEGCYDQHACDQEGREEEEKEEQEERYAMIKGQYRKLEEAEQGWKRYGSRSRRRRRRRAKGRAGHRQ